LENGQQTVTGCENQGNRTTYILIN